jgi:hypothetical protein
MFDSNYGVSPIRSRMQSRLINLNKKFLDLDQSLFFKDSSLKTYLVHILLSSVKSIFENRFSFPDSAKIYIDPICSFCEKENITNQLFVITDENFNLLSECVKNLHSKYIWNVHKVEARTVYSIPDKYEFIKNSHYLLKNIRDKILKVEVFKFFGVNNNFFNYVNPNTKKDIRRKSKYSLSERFDGNSVNTSRLNSGKIIEGVKFDSLPTRLVNYLNHYELNCSFGVKRGVHDAVRRHERPDNMVVFDISKFFNTFKISNIVDYKLFDRIYEIFESTILNTPFRDRKKYKINYSYKKDSYYFYKIIDMFFYNGVLPTGSVFASDLVNLLFFSVDHGIAKVLEDHNNMISSKYPFFKMSGGSSKFYGLVYTRYIDDICISTDFNNLSRKRPNGFFPSSSNESSDIDYRDLFIGMPIVKNIEKILNSNGFYIKYDKTKIYSYKMDKKYLGFNFTRKDIIRRGPGVVSIYPFIKNSRYIISAPSSVRYEFNKNFYNFSSLKKGEQDRVTSLFHYYSNPFSSKTFMFTTILNSDGKTGYDQFRIIERQKKKRRPVVEFYKLDSGSRKFFFRQ